LSVLALERAWAWMETRSLDVERVALIALVIVLVAANTFPMWTGRYQGSRSASGIPSYWDAALNELQRREGPERALFVPGSLLIDYRWGGLMEGLGQVRPSISSLVPWPFPVGARYRSNLLAAVEEPYQQGLAAAGEADLIRY